ncbi:hypothetical protein AKJ16_DCAP06531, partial [Drosera capensis]
AGHKSNSIELQGTQLLRTTLAVKELVQSEFQKVEEVVLSHQQLLASPVKLDDFFWASEILRSRAFTQLSGESLVLVPLADLIASRVGYQLRASSSALFMFRKALSFSKAAFRTRKYFATITVKQLSFTGREEDDPFHGHGSINEETVFYADASSGELARVKSTNARSGQSSCVGSKSDNTRRDFSFTRGRWSEQGKEVFLFALAFLLIEC